ncbi:ABC transporter ATP-binding protein [Pseudonocardia alni subsp. carboxydivorans]|uniref:ABC transporter ATP-binding protein n=1 Tax=Pseudonocardia alni subsp. carboxydivorans TaxID=415010 RepID=A0ABU9AH12_PSEA5
MSLRAEGLTCVLGGRTVLTGIDLAVEPGEVLGVVGPNGSGKSTLLRALAGIRGPAAGRVLLDGTPLTALRARQRARRIAFVGQEEDLPPDLCAGEVVALGLVPHRPPWAGGDALERAAVTAALAAVELDGLADRPVDRLSGGERRRVLLARGLAQDAGVLLLDEPTNHLDVRHALGLLELVRSLRRTVVVSLHDLDLADRWCDRLVVLHDGRALPAVSDLDPDTVSRVFGVAAARVTHPVTGRSRLVFDSLRESS